ncbi:MAG: peptide ABC transporter substrate-binding protein [Spirochaetia bacterium]
MKRVFLFLSLFCILCNALYAEDEQTFTMVASPTNVAYDPHHTFTAFEAQFYTGIYEGLVSYHPITMEPLPAVAHAWEISEDRRTYTFTIRRNARYWNGDRITAEHFYETWFRLIDPQEDADYAFLFDIIQGVPEYRSGESDDRDSVGIQAINENTLEVTLTQPATHFLKILCHHSFVPIHPDFIDIDDWSGHASIPGNGPYYIHEKSEEEILLRRNRYYWDSNTVSIPQIRILFTDNASRATALFNSGEAHWLADSFSIQELHNRNAIVLNPMFATSYFFFHVDSGPWEDYRIRRALALLLPWQSIRGERYFPTDRLVPDIPYYPEPEGIEAPNRQEALRLLEESGYAQGEGLPEIEIHIPEGSESRRIAEIMQESWEETLSVNVIITAMNYTGYFESLANNESYTLGTLTWIGDFPDPLTFLQMWSAASNLNDSGYTDPAFESAMENATSLTGRERYQALSEAEEVLLQGAIVLPLSHTPSLNIIDLGVIDGWIPNPLDLHPFKYLAFSALRELPGLALLED